MANIIRSFIRIKANESAINLLDEKLNNCQYGIDNIVSFAEAFYIDVPVSDFGVSNKWSLDNVGSKWAYLYDNIDAGYFSIESAWYYPDKFISHLYRLLSEHDSDLTIELKWQDESMTSVGVVVVAKDGDGVYRFSEGEHGDITNPLMDIDSDNDDYDGIQEDFIDMVMDIQDELLNDCYDNIRCGDAINWLDAITDI